MNGNRLYKYEKLCSKTAIDLLFKDGKAAIAYPLRVVYRFVEPGENPPTCRFMITVPKKKMRHAVDRVWLRRRIREAYRLNRNAIYPALEASGKDLEIAFLYIADNKKQYDTIERKMTQILQKISAVLVPPVEEETQSEAEKPQE